MENQEKRIETEVVAEVQTAKADSAVPEADKDPQAMRRESIQKAITVLCEKFPKAFSLKQEEIKPLKIGIINDLKEKISELDGISLSKIRAAVRKYTYSIQYLDVVKEGAKRVDLDGNALPELGSTNFEPRFRFGFSAYSECGRLRNGGDVGDFQRDCWNHSGKRFYSGADQPERDSEGRL